MKFGSVGDLIRGPYAEKIRNGLFAAFLVAAIAAKLALVSDLSVQIIFSPHDDSLYVMRALNLLNGAGFGAYDGRLLIKLPGISLCLAGLRILGLPYMFTLNLLYIAAGLYFLSGLARCGFGRAGMLLAMTLYLFNPVTFIYEWTRIFREPLSTVLLVTLLAAMLHVLLAVRDRRNVLPHMLVLGCAFSIALLVREEDRLLWGAYLIFFVVVLIQDRWSALRVPVHKWRTLGFVALLPAAMALGANFVIHAYVESRYGLPIVYEFGEGEFPKLLAAIRGIETRKDNRLVMVPQEALAKLRSEVPDFAPVVDRIPPPGPKTYSCQLQGVCSEWSNGWMPFWIRDAAADAGLTPDLPTAQKYFRRIRGEIEEACRSGRLVCRYKGSGLIPPFELRWTRAYLHELRRLAGMFLMPTLNVAADSYVDLDVSTELANIFRVVTMTDNQVRPNPQNSFLNPIASWRANLIAAYRPLALVLLLLSVPALGYLWTKTSWREAGPFLWVTTVFAILTGVRIAVLAYGAVFFGPFTSRLAFSTYAVAAMLAPLILIEAARQFHIARKP